MAYGVVNGQELMGMDGHWAMSNGQIFVGTWGGQWALGNGQVFVGDGLWGGGGVGSEHCEERMRTRFSCIRGMQCEVRHN